MFGNRKRSSHSYLNYYINSYEYALAVFAVLLLKKPTFFHRQSIFYLQEAGYNQLKATSSSYSLHVAFKPQKLFPTKPSKLTSNWPSVLSRFTKTAPYYDEPAPSPGPYYPSSPNDKTLPAQSPLTLDKVNPYEFDGEYLVSFYNYEPEAIKRMTSGANLHVGFDFEKSENNEGETVDGSTTKIQLCEPGKGKVERSSQEFCHLEKSNKEFKTGQHNASCKSIRNVSNSVDYQGESSRREENDSESWNRHETIITCSPSEVTSELNEQAKKTDSKALGVSKTGPYERPEKNDNSTPVIGSKQDNGMNIKCDDSRLSHEKSPANLLKESEMSKVAGVSPGTSGLKRNPLSDAKTDLVLNFQANISQKNAGSGQTEQCITGSSKGIAELASFKAPVPWGKSTRKSVEEGLAMVQNTGLMIVQNSSVCVMIPRVTDRRHAIVNALRRRCATLIMNPAFDWLIIAVIFVNTVVMATEYHGMNQRLESTLYNINLVSTVTGSDLFATGVEVLTVEILTQQ